MKKILIVLLFVLPSINNLSSQSITEKEIFRLTYKGDADAYNFIYDSSSSNYCYLYRPEDENKVFIISNNSVSEKYDNIYAEDIRFDSEGNYYVIGADFKKDYGVDNNFLIVNGKNVLNYNYIESYNAFINNNEDYVFIFKESEQYKIGYYNIDSGFRKSEGYESIKPIYNYKAIQYHHEGEAEGYRSEDFYLNENGERGFIAISNGKAKIVFETSEIQTTYNDINELSFSKNKNNELSFIAKTGAKFYEKVGNEFVVSGNNAYDKFELVSTPLSFNNTDEPVYTAGDSVGEFKFIYYPVIGNKKIIAYSDINNSEQALEFNYGLSDFKIESDGKLSYIGAEEIIIPAKQAAPDETVYDEYYSRSFFIQDGIANELAYSIGPVKYNGQGDMLYSGIADLKKKDVLLMLNYGSSKIIINREKFDDVFEYGFSKDNEIYYIGQNYGDDENKKNETFIYIGDQLIGKYEYVTYQNTGDEGSIIKFDKRNNFAFAIEEKVDSNTFKSFVVTKSGKLPFPSNAVNGSKMFSYISELMFTADGKLFFIGDMIYDPVAHTGTKEIFVDNKSLGKIYNTINNVEYDETENIISFAGSRGKAIYFVHIKL
ncbi:MAG: hypothetical protein M3R36_16465 [Bacteroidota bacterium]|nr:hypothetical protein [Bacteroidota bacterium]